MKDAQLVQAVLEGGAYTHAKLAKSLNYKSAKTVSRWLSGETRLTPEALDQLRCLYMQLGNRYGDSDEIKYLHLYAGVYTSAEFDPVKAFRDAFMAFEQLSPRKICRIEWAYGNSRYYRRDFEQAEMAYVHAIEAVQAVELGWVEELLQNLVGTRLELSKRLLPNDPKWRETLEDALDACQQVIANTPDAIAYVNALEVASQLELGDHCDHFLTQLIEVNENYRDPHYKPNRHSRALGEAKEFEFLRTLSTYKRLCCDQRDLFTRGLLRMVK